METQSSFSVSKWTIFTTIGVIAGVILVLILAALLESLKLEDNSIIGIAMGLCIGLMQWLLIRKQIKQSFKWVWLLVVGMTVPIILLEIVTLIFKIKSEYYMLAIILAGGLLSGYLQYQFCLKNTYINAKQWIRFSFLGWLAAVLITSVSFLPIILHMELTAFFKLLNTFAIILCGPVLGFITGKGIVSILKNENKLQP